MSEKNGGSSAAPRRSQAVRRTREAPAAPPAGHRPAPEPAGGAVRAPARDEHAALLAELEGLRHELALARQQSLAYAVDLARGFADERRQAQVLKQTQAQLGRSAKLAVLGQMSAALAHDMANLLSPAVGYGELLLARKDLSPEARKYAERIQRSLARSTQLLRSLMNFSAQRAAPCQPLALPAVVSAVAGLLEYRLARKSIRLVVDLAPDLPRVPGDKGQLEQVLVNLVVNAQQAMEPAGGELRITGRRITDAVRVSVSDQGCGIPPEHQEKVFEPFFTTKGEGRGTGLGLFICHQIIVQHGGRITVRSALAQGTTFEIDLPVWAEGTKA